MGETKKISDYVLEDRITGFFAVRRKVIRDFTRGQFVSLELGDFSGRVSAVWWEPDQFALTELETGMVVKVRGVVTEYKGRLQLTIDQLRLARPGEYELEQILPHSSIPVEKRRVRIAALVEKLQNGYIKALAESLFHDEPFFDAYLRAAAGKLWHHAYIGGLSEHSANVAQLCLDMSLHYKFLDKDLLIFGGLFHDAGKIEQYSIDTVIEYTDSGRLVGHLCLADQWICERAAGIEAFPRSLLTKLRHIILSHHGELQYASPVVPQMPEAFVLYYCDELDSKMGAITRIRNRHDGVGWSGYVNLLSRHLYFGDKPLESPDE